ncbi:hypothetical protein CLOP_g5543 [Closterium sp. NIES-67]|nr:hypothetical protein CLOP_g5543 [Closterium sp. NIES-67]
MVWCGMLLLGMVWYVTAWRGVVCYCMASCGMLLHGMVWYVTACGLSMVWTPMQDAEVELGGTNTCA